ncbi:hypothetical protein [Hansschlegelia sp.]|uniref:hypothetical protein n=1 Tax=Hansschlegelia sp. TaxID=2041892 RepID=UPI002CC3F9B3|nr:hypothetical protein [Hansschlegelia sp.]HVI27509.1 hypothetical protein [Hansschlegelia sp.]
MSALVRYAGYDRSEIGFGYSRDLRSYYRELERQLRPQRSIKAAAKPERPPEPVAFLPATISPAKAPPNWWSLPELRIELPGDGWRRVLRETCKKYGVAEASVLARGKRGGQIVLARQEFFWRLVNEIGLSYAEAGRRVGRDHTSIRYGALNHQARIDRGEA